jgi:hypothetical protein
MHTLYAGTEFPRALIFAGCVTGCCKRLNLHFFTCFKIVLTDDLNYYSDIVFAILC